MDSIKRIVKLLGSAELSQVWGCKHILRGSSRWVPIALCPRFKRNLGGHLDIFNNALSLVIREVSRIKVQGDCLNCGVDNLDGLRAIDLGHAFYFLKGNIVSKLEDVLLVFVNGHYGFLSFLNHNNNKVLGLFAIVISDDVFSSKIYKSIPPWSKSLG